MTRHDPAVAARPLRVLVVGQAPHTPGGMATVQRLHEQTLHARDDVAARTVATYTDAGVLTRLRVMLAGLAQALAPIAGGRVDVVHVHAGKGLSALRKAVVLSAARARGVATVLHVHAGAFADWFDGLPPWLRTLVRRGLRADRVLALSAATREVLLDRLDVAPADVVVVANPVPWPDPLPPRPRPAGADPALHVVFLGRLVDRKGVFDLLDSVAALTPPERGRLRLTLAGHGDLAAVRARLAAAGLEGRATVHAWLDPARRDALLADADVLALPSWWENLPMAVLEAMARGLAPVVTPVGGLAELVRDGQNGLVVPVGSPAALTAVWRRLLADPDLAAQLGRRARVDVRDHGLDAWGERVVGLYREISPAG